jgi:hypothetical protein
MVIQTLKNESLWCFTCIILRIHMFMIRSYGVSLRSH